MDIRQIRRIKTLELIKQKGISKAEFSRLLGKSPQQMNELLREKNPKNIGHNIARLIESTFEKESGWLDKEDTVPVLEDEKPVIDPDVKQSYREACRYAQNFVRARDVWLIHRTLLFRQIEDNLREWLIKHGYELQLPEGRFDFAIKSPAIGQASINLFIPVPGFTQWSVPVFDDEKPDFLALPLMPKTKNCEPGFYFLSRGEYSSVGDSDSYIDFDDGHHFQEGQSCTIAIRLSHYGTLPIRDTKEHQRGKLFDHPVNNQHAAHLKAITTKLMAGESPTNI